jgi:hypothetical protein
MDVDSGMLTFEVRTLACSESEAPEGWVVKADHYYRIRVFTP